MRPSAIRLCATALCVASLGSMLSACAPIMLGGAAMGALVATDRRTSGTQLEDEGIELRSIGRINENLGDRVHVNVTSYNRQVLLTGEVPSAQDKQLVEQIVSRVDNVRLVANELAVLGSSSLTQRSSDSLITGKVKAAMVDSKDLFANAFKVVTERGIVYLMGRVTQREADRATDIARSTGGVQKVVRLLEIISEEELQRTLPAQSPQTPPKS
ncbi:MAG: BON domain-containing protein [Rhodoferax sp.]|nr:BON domain-containing protein [Rhodoferax sp.]